jgi:hypothetical protein
MRSRSQTMPFTSGSKPANYSSSPGGTRPDRKRMTGSSSKSPSSASPVRDQAMTPTRVSASRSAVRQAVCADLHATAGSARRRVPRPARNDWTMNSVSWAMERILKKGVYTASHLSLGKRRPWRECLYEMENLWWIDAVPRRSGRACGRLTIFRARCCAVPSTFLHYISRAAR